MIRQERASLKPSTAADLFKRAVYDNGPRLARTLRRRSLAGSLARWAPDKAGVAAAAPDNAELQRRAPEITRRRYKTGTVRRRRPARAARTTRRRVDQTLAERPVLI